MKLYKATTAILMLGVITSLSSQTVTDIDGNVYNTVTIGTQVWMKENLRTASYANGDPITNVTDNNQWAYLNAGAYAWYDNNSSYGNPYGGLYNWFAVTDARNICPTGWHAPEATEWTVLFDYLGGSSVAGGKMKATGTTYWQSPNGDATNESGFTGLPGGYRPSFFNNLGETGYWWYSTYSVTQLGWYFYLNDANGTITEYNTNKRSGFSVRCVNDLSTEIKEQNENSYPLLNPNPTTGQFTLALPEAGNYSIEVYNMVGQVVYATEIKNAAAHNVDLGNVPVGVYSARVRNEKGNFNYSMKLLVIK